MRDLAILAERVDWVGFVTPWNWLVPPGHRPWLIGAFGDWIFVGPDGSYFSLCLLEGDYRQIARTGPEFDTFKRDVANLDDWFKATFVEMASRAGLIPELDECLGWAIHPALGGPFEVSNIQVYPLMVYQTATAALFQQLDRV